MSRQDARSFIVAGERETTAALTATRPAMIASLDRLRPILEDLGGAADQGVRGEGLPFLA